MKDSRFEKLPKRLTISFPLWLIYGTKGEYSPYYDIDKALLEHKERGFNCVRIDGGAGLIHDLEGNLRAPFDFERAFGKFEQIPRQQAIMGDGGPCNLLERLIETFTCARRHGVYVILSSWYYLHTYWLHKKNDPVCEEMFALTPEQRIPAFAKFWHYILLELEKRGLTDMLAFVEIFNEMDDHPYLCGTRRWGSNPNTLVTDEERAFFKAQHEQALAWLKSEHPSVIFAYDAARSVKNDACVPNNADVYNFHCYYLWNAYNWTIPEHPEWRLGKVTEADVVAVRDGRLPAAPDWYEREALYNDIDYKRVDEIEAAIEKTVTENYSVFTEKLDTALEWALENANGLPLVCGEGVSYIAAKAIMWEEKSDTYWSLVKYGIQKFKEAGMWGTVIRTCMGPEDPAWDMCKDKILEINRYFLED